MQAFRASCSSIEPLKVMHKTRILAAGFILNRDQELSNNKKFRCCEYLACNLPCNEQNVIHCSPKSPIKIDLEALTVQKTMK